MAGDAEASAVRVVGAAKAEAYKQGSDALGTAAYTAMQVAAILGEHHVKVVPDIAVSGEATTGLASAFVARLVHGSGSER
jgi:hypothetical protein